MQVNSVNALTCMISLNTVKQKTFVEGTLMKLAQPVFHKSLVWKRVAIGIFFTCLVMLLMACETTPIAGTSATVGPTVVRPTQEPGLLSTQVSTPTPTPIRPPSRGSAHLVYDGQSGGLLLFGGSGTGPVLGIDDTWTWNGSTWTQQHPVHSPPPRDNGAIAYDAATHQVVLFGGVSDEGNTPIIGDTWIWNGSDWIQQHPATSPPARDFASMAYDAATGQLILFGGGEGGKRLPNQAPPPLNDTWTWNGANWMQLHPANVPGARSQAGMVYDAAVQSVILFGGLDARGPTELNDTWAWNGSNWLQLQPKSQPPLSIVIPGDTLYLDEPTMAYDAATHQIVLALMGSSQNTHTTRQVDWVWDGTTWSPLQGATPDGEYGILAYDPALHSVIELTFYLHALEDIFENKLWQWDGQKWRLLDDWS